MGETEWDLASIDDFVIAREDGSPTFLLANCVDDLEMDIVVRGLDHQSNSPKQSLLRQMLGAAPVKWAHLPLIVGEDGKKLSKRSSNTQSPLSISALRRAGFHPGSIRSVLARLGWGTNHEELLDLPELLESFDLTRVSTSPAHFDSKKLRHVNGVKLRSLPLEDYASELLAYAERPLDSRAFKAAVCARPRSQTWEEASDISSFLYLPYTIDPTAWEKTMNQDSLDILLKLKNDIAGYPEDGEKIDILLHDFIKRANLKPGKAFQPLRVALCGSKIGPALGHLIWALGVDESLKRIQHVIGLLQSDTSLIKTEN
jgi:glutamyl-tRNA synthetase